MPLLFRDAQAVRLPPGWPPLGAAPFQSAEGLLLSSLRRGGSQGFLNSLHRGAPLQSGVLPLGCASSHRQSAQGLLLSSLAWFRLAAFPPTGTSKARGEGAKAE
eukprot:1159445-Pelagomonas_calceolata.AAC.5